VAWSVPRNRRPNPIRLRLKSLGLLTLIGASVLAITIVSTLGNETEVFGPRLDAHRCAGLVVEASGTGWPCHVSAN
jgi:hypothetical protein